MNYLNDALLVSATAMGYGLASGGASYISSLYSARWYKNLASENTGKSSYYESISDEIYSSICSNAMCISLIGATTFVITFASEPLMHLKHFQLATAFTSGAIGVPLFISAVYKNVNFEKFPLDNILVPYNILISACCIAGALTHGATKAVGHFR